MRVTGGVYKGRTIACPPGIIRPAMDRMRESMFAILGDLSGCSFLDLYAGSGVVGVEAASRGASPVVFVEKDFGKKAVLQRNLSLVRESTQLQLVPAERFLRRCKSRFDIIFLDPPYGQKGTVEVMGVIVDRRLLAPGGTLLLHVPREQAVPERVGGLQQTDCRRYGRAVLLFYAWAGEVG
jgi:16S rRNA (guanine966-N2)-methyltransferase